LGFLLIAAMVLLIIGLIKPQKIVFWAKNKTKKMALLGYGCALVVIIVLGCVTAPNQAQTTMTSASKPVTSSAKVISSSKPEAVSSKSSLSKPETISSTPSLKNIQTSSRQSQTQQSNSLSVQYYFPRGGQNLEPILIGLINSAKSSLDIAQSMSRAGCPYDNAPMERYFNTLKNELIYHHYYHNGNELNEAVNNFAYIWYNHVRPHTFNGGLTPFEARNKFVNIRLQCYKNA